VKISPTQCAECYPPAVYDHGSGECQCPPTQLKIAPNRCSKCNFWERWNGQCCVGCPYKTTKFNITTCLPCNETTTIWKSGFCFCLSETFVHLSPITCIPGLPVIAQNCKDKDLPGFCFFPLNKFLPQCYDDMIGKILGGLPVFSASHSLYRWDSLVLGIWVVLMVYLCKS
jgi:hypothetical protein